MRTSFLVTIALLLLSSMAIAQNIDPFKDSLIIAMLEQKDSTALKQQIATLANSTSENDLVRLSYYYGSKNNKAGMDDTKQLAIKKFPKGSTAFGEALGPLYEEKDPIQNEKNYKVFMAKWSTVSQYKGHRFFDFARYYVANSYVGKNNLEKIKEWLNMIQDTVYKTQAFSYAARETFAAKEYTLAEELIKKSLQDLKRRADSVSANYYTYIKAYANTLYQNMKYEQGFKYAKAAYDQSQQKDAQLNETYMNLLVATNRLKEAYPMMEKSIVEGRASGEVKAQFKNAYIAVYGNDNGFAEHEALTYQRFKDTIRAEVLKKMINEPAFNFTVKDLKGKTVSLSDYKGKILVLDFWATWCGPCKASFPFMQSAVDKYKDDPNVVFLFIHTWEKSPDPVRDARDYIKSKQYTFNVLMDLKDPVTKECNAAVGYKLTGIPAKFIIDKNGNTRFSTVGSPAGGNDAFLEEMDAMIDLTK